MGPELAATLQRQALDVSSYQARCKRAAALLDWMDGVPLSDLEGKYTVNPFFAFDSGVLRGLADTSRYHLRSVVEIATLSLATAEFGEHEVETFLARLEFGVPAEAVALAALRLPRGDLLALYASGVRHPDDLADWTPGELDRILGRENAVQLDSAP